MADVIFMTGARGGAGVTTCAVNLGYALSDEGERTLLVDGDNRCGSGLEICGLQNLSVYTLGDVEKGACRVKQAILQHPVHTNLYVLPSLDCASSACIEQAVKECEPLFDRIICDGVAQGACRRALLVTSPYSCFLQSAKRRGAEIKDAGFKDVGLVANRVNGGLVYDGSILPPKEFAAVARVPLCGVIPEDLTLPVGKIRAGTKRAFFYLAAALMGRSDRIYSAVKPYAGLKGKIKRKLRESV